MGRPLKTRAALGLLVAAGVLGVGLGLPGVALAVTSAPAAVALDPNPQPDPQNRNQNRGQQNEGQQDQDTKPTAGSQPTAAPPEPTASPPTAATQPTAAAPAPVVTTTQAPPTQVGPTPEELAAQKAAETAAAEAAAEKKARQLAAAQKAAAQLAQAQQRAQATWSTHGKPGKLIIVRASSIDTVTGGRLTRHVTRSSAAIGLSDLARYVPAAWLSINGGTAQLSAAMVLSKGVTFTMGGGGLTDVALVGGATPDAAASIYTGGGTLVVHDVTVASRDTATNAPMGVGSGRPYVVVTGDGTLNATDATMSDLGTMDGPDGTPGVAFNKGSAGSLVRTTMLRNSIGVELNQSQGVHLDTLTVNQSVTDGLVLRGDEGTTMTGVSAVGNLGNGVLVSSESTARPITGISTKGNTAFGVVVAGQTKPQINNIKADHDGLGGLRINRCSDPAVSDVTLTDEPIGILSHVGSSHVALDRITIDGGRRGLVVEKTTAGLDFTGSTISGAQLGVAIGGQNVTLRDITVTDTQTGVAAQRGSANVSVTGLKLSGGKDGFVADAGTSGVILQDITSVGVENTAVRILSPNAQLMGGRISGSTTGLHVEAAATITGTQISNVDTGIRVRSTDPIRADQVSVDAVTVGVDAAPGAVFLLSNSRVHALESIRGTVTMEGVNDLSLPALSVLGAIGVPLILLAVVLELIHAIRQRVLQVPGGVGRRTPPPLPAGAG